MIIRITAPHFCAGVVVEVDKGYVVKAAPIVKYMLEQRWTPARVFSYCATKRWKAEVLNKDESAGR